MHCRIEGEWAGGKRTGKGKQIWPDGRMFDGYWNSNRQKGYGVETKSNGDRYEGMWKGGQKEGRGTLWEEGRKYSGMWKDGKRNGQGELVVEGGLHYTGGWLDDKYHGYGVEVLGSGGKYEGEWKLGKQDGKGVFHGADGTIYEGCWRDGLYDGAGKLVWPGGHCYEGDFVSHKLTGQGVCTWPGGYKFVGRLRDDKPIEGEVWEEDGTIKEVTCDGKVSFWLGLRPIIIKSRDVSTLAERENKAAKEEEARAALVEASNEVMRGASWVEWRFVLDSTGGLAEDNLLPGCQGGGEGGRGGDGGGGGGGGGRRRLYRAMVPSGQVPVADVEQQQQQGARRFLVQLVADAESLRSEAKCLAEAVSAGGHPSIPVIQAVCRGGKDASGIHYHAVLYGSDSFALLSHCLGKDAKQELAMGLTWMHRAKVLGGVSGALSFMFSECGVLHGRVGREVVCLTNLLEPLVVGWGEAQVGQGIGGGEGERGGGERASGGACCEYLHCPRFLKTRNYSEKSEVYSLGVLMLETLVGRLSSAECDLVHVFVEDEEDDLKASLDQRAGSWGKGQGEGEDEEIADGLCSLAARCVGPMKKRPTLEEVDVQLKRLCGSLPSELAIPEGCLDAREGYLTLLAPRGGAGAGAGAGAIDGGEVIDGVVGHGVAESGGSNCVVCFDDVRGCVMAAVCSGEGRHTICAECFSDLVINESKSDQAALQRRKGRIFCPLVVMGDCNSEPFTDQEVALRVNAEAHECYMQAQKRLIEQRVRWGVGFRLM